jgi:hypothetical protein
MVTYGTVTYATVSYGTVGLLLFLPIRELRN